jgi:hypothetical protein
MSEHRLKHAVCCQCGARSEDPILPADAEDVLCFKCTKIDQLTIPPEDWKFEISDQVKGAMEKDPEVAEFIRDTNARIRQVISDFQAGKHANVEDALRAIGMKPVEDDE